MGSKALQKLEKMIGSNFWIKSKAIAVQNLQKLIGSNFSQEVRL